ncbi:MAG: TonB family protein [Candidatus Acidiferrum sp.]
MAPISKENEVLTATTEATATISAPPGGRVEDTASRPQPVALEVPVSVNGARTVEGSDKREPFSETTKTVLVFGNGAVIRLGSPVAAGQLLFLTNEKTKKEVVCQVVKSKNYRNVSGYVELEFTEPVVGFWGMRFPTDRIAAHAPAASIAAAPVKNVPSATIPVASKVASPAAGIAPKVPVPSSSQIHAEAKPTLQGHSPEAGKSSGALSRPEAGPMQTPAVTAEPATAKHEKPATPAAPVSASLSSSIASLLTTPETQVSLTAAKPAGPPVPLENKPAAGIAAVENSGEELKLQAARLQEKLSSMLFSGTPAAKPTAPVQPIDTKSISKTVDQFLEVAKSDSVPFKAMAPAKTVPPPIKSSLDSEEVKIPSWLEPLARNAAASGATQEHIEREKPKHVPEATAHEEHVTEHSAGAEAENASEIQMPVIGSMFQMGEGLGSGEQSSGGSRKGMWIGMVAAVVLLAGGGWYMFQRTNLAKGTSAPVAPATSAQPSGVPGGTSGALPMEQPESRNESAEPRLTASTALKANGSSPVQSEPTGASSAVAERNPVVRDNTRGSATTIPAVITERISRPAAEPEVKKPSLGDVYLSSPTMNHAGTAQEGRVVAPSISAGNTNSQGFASGLATENEKQPVAPEVPLPIGGDVKSARLISEVAPIYPVMAKNQHVSGDVVVDALIDATGRVTTMKVISGPTLLHQAAMNALRHWKYQPATLDGKAVAMHLTVTLQFRMQ